MKRKLLTLALVLVLAVSLVAMVACSDLGLNTNTNANTNTNTQDNVTVDDPAVDTTFPEVEESTADFSLVTEDGAVTQEGSVYTITAAGTYTLSGALNGQIVVNAGDDDAVVLELSGVTITCATDSPIKILNADSCEISAKKNTQNVIKDARSAKTTDDDTQGAGAIYSTCDLKLKGNGTLVVEAGYNNGIHTKDDLKIKNVTLKVTAVNNALKGNDSVTIESGTLVLIATEGDGIETENTDVSSKGNQRGIITIEDGTVSVYAAGDGIQAAYDVVVNGGTINVYTGAYSAYTSANSTCDSFKGIKADNEVTINDGTLYICSYDDGLHANYGDTFDNGEKGVGNVNVSGGSITITVYSPTKTTAMGGRVGPGGPGGQGGMGGMGYQQQEVKGSDGIHADNTLTISGGTLVVDSAYEGLEATHIVISGGNISVYATDDGLNAAAKITGTPSILISGGYLNVTVPSNGDTDGIDSNGTYSQTGGMVVVCGPGSASGRQGGGAFALDAERTISVTGGTLVVFGGIEGTPSASGVTRTLCSSSTVAAGSHTLTLGETSYTVNLQYATSGCVVYSELGSATLK